ncbi:MAG: hypothetical protein ABSG91_10900 [Syntrophobacteraceae bacterium]
MRKWITTKIEEAMSAFEEEARRESAEKQQAKDAKKKDNKSLQLRLHLPCAPIRPAPDAPLQARSRQPSDAVPPPRPQCGARGGA